MEPSLSGEVGVINVDGNHRASVEPDCPLVHELLEAQVGRSPHAVAVAHDGQLLTYAELNCRANQLAQYLGAKGVGNGDLVGICLARSLEMVVALVAILKSGAGYVPLDPSYPTERIKYMVADAEPRLVLTQRELNGLIGGASAQVVFLDEAIPELAHYGSENLPRPELRSRMTNLVYVIYTSGTTGRPKGVAMSHRALVNLIEWHRDAIHSNEAQRVLQLAALSFDVAFQEIFTTLCTGGTLVLSSERMRQDVRELAKFLCSESIQRIFITPSRLQNLAEAIGAAGAAPSSLRDIVAAGEQLRVSPEVSSLFRRLSGCRLHNHYGPTETHVVTATTLTGDPDRWPVLPTIGRPIANSQIHILDESDRPAPIGKTGEIYIGGSGLAQGYWRQPELTARRFIVGDRSGEIPGRLYRTGDMGRWMPDGDIEYLGRRDSQVKIRGFRVELGEIEARLTAHDAVKECVVVMREDTLGRQQLVAYFTVREHGDTDVEELRAYLKLTLPDYMIPSAFVALEKLPLTANGKVERHNLPRPEGNAYSSRPHESPRRGTEQELAQIWQDLLDLPAIGRDDNFFGLGGHSLLGLKLILAVEKRFGLPDTPITIFQCPTISEMARLVERLQGAIRASMTLDAEVVDNTPPSTPMGTLGPRASSRPIPLTFSQQHLWNRLGLSSGQSVRWTFPQRLLGPLDVKALRESFVELVRRHEALRIRISNAEGLPLQSFESEPQLQFDVIDLSASAGTGQVSDARRVLECISDTRTNIFNTSLFSVSLLKIRNADHVLVLCIDHLIFDGISINILLRDLWELYDHHTCDSPLSLPEVKVQFADYAAWQEEARHSRTHRHDDYWRAHLAGAQRVRLLANEASKGNAAPRISSFPFQLGKDLFSKLVEFSRSEGTSLAMSLLTAHTAMLLRWCERDDIVVPLTTIGRFHAEVENTVGYFSAILLLRVRLREHESFVDLLRHIVSEHNAAYEHYDFGKTLAQTPLPEAAANPGFNWNPKRLDSSPERHTFSQRQGIARDRISVWPFMALQRWPHGYDRDIEPKLSVFETENDVTINYRVHRVAPDESRRLARNLIFFAEKLISEPRQRVASVCSIH